MSSPVGLQSVLQRYLSGYEQAHRLSARERQVCAHIGTCRTEVLGEARLCCEQCDYSASHCLACRDRHCPKCQHRERDLWCDRQRADVLPVVYHHVVFTLPSDLNGWIGLHPKVLYHQLFQCAWKTLAEFGADPKRLNGQMGMIGVLHTWGEALTRHVHLHCLVPGGALSSDKRWHSAKSEYLFPVRALSRCFRGKFVSALRTQASLGNLHRVKQANEMDNLLDRLMSKDWVVFSKPCPNRSGQVIDYLGRYSHRIAISDQRIVSCEGGQVCFHIKDYANDGERKVMTLDAGEFIRRYLLHVLPKGLMRIRHYGFLANSCRRARLSTIRQALQERPHGVEAQQHKESIQSKPTSRVTLCPRCKTGYLSVKKKPRTASLAPHRSRDNNMTLH